MSWPPPRPGLVIRYSYLWTDEAASGRDEGIKDRPCAVVLSVDGEAGTRVYVLPVTHTPPTRDRSAIELPPRVQARLGLDEERSWVVVTEANSFMWPGPDLRPIPGRGVESIAYGYLSPSLFTAIRDAFVAEVRSRRADVTARTT